MAQAQKLSTTQIWSDLQALPHCQMARCMTATWCYSVFNKEEAFTAWHERQAKYDKSMGSETACSKKMLNLSTYGRDPFIPTCSEEGNISALLLPMYVKVLHCWFDKEKWMTGWIHYLK